MSQRMQRFLSVRRELPERRLAPGGGLDFAEVRRPFAPPAAAAQASRCEQCGIPFCQLHCPLHNNIPDWLKLSAEGRLEEAYRVGQATNSFPEICGRICPQERLCEGSCVIEQSRHGAVTIGAVEAHITDTAWDKGWVEALPVGPERGRSVGIVGAGPAGLACASRLRGDGYRVDIYDRHDRMGGLLVYGIPNFKLDKSVVERRAGQLAEAGVVFHPNVDVGVGCGVVGVGGGGGLPFAELRQRHDAVLVAVGLTRPRALELPGAGLDNVLQAIDYLIASNRKGLGVAEPEFDSGRLNAEGKRVVVIGAGDTAMDCANTAVRQGARSVTCVEMFDRADMDSSTGERAHAEEAGVEIRWLTTVEAFLGEGALGGVRAVRLHAGPPGADGRRTFDPVPGSAFTIGAEMVIQALGFVAQEAAALYGEPAPELTGWGTVKVDPETMATSLDGVYAAGDVVRGASLAVWAIRDGHTAARAIDAYLRNAGTAVLAAAS